MAYGYSQVKNCIGLMCLGKFQQAMKALKAMQPTRYGVVGMPDLGGILANGRSLGIECKMYGKVQDEDQVKWQAMFERFGGLYILAYTVEDVYDGLRAAGVPV